MIRDFMDRRLREAWESESWPELCRIEQRQYRASWSSATTYVAGDEVYYPASGKYYCAVQGSNTNNAPATGSPLAQNSAWWAEMSQFYSNTEWVIGSYAVGNRVRYPTTGYDYQCIAVATTQAPTDTAKWGRLIEFDAYIAYAQTGLTAIGEALAVYDYNPRLRDDWDFVEFTLSHNGVQVINGPTVVALEYRTRPPTFTGSVWVSGTSYTASSSQVYYETGGVGNFYNCIQSTSSVAPTNTAYWTVVEIPFLFQSYLIRAIYADLIVFAKQDAKSHIAVKYAEQILAYEADKLYRQQGQIRRIQRTTY